MPGFLRPKKITNGHLPTAIVLITFTVYTYEMFYHKRNDILKKRKSLKRNYTLRLLTSKYNKNIFCNFE